MIMAQSRYRRAVALAFELAFFHKAVGKFTIQ
jgi:hypothetical protein